MIYYYEKNGLIMCERAEEPPLGVTSITRERMIPMPMTDEGHDPVLRADFETDEVWYDIVENLTGARNRIIALLTTHDKSREVEVFHVGEVAMWLDRDTRTSLARNISVQQAAGATMFSIWSEDAKPVRFDLPIDMAAQMLAALETYATETYNVTQGHKAALYDLQTVAELEGYDYKAGYPEILKF